MKIHFIFSLSTIEFQTIWQILKGVIMYVSDLESCNQDFQHLLSKVLVCFPILFFANQYNQNGCLTLIEYFYTTLLKSAIPFLFLH